MTLMSAVASGGALAAIGDPYLSALDANLSIAPVAHWTFNDLSGVTLTDRGGIYDGTYSGAPTLGVAGLQPKTTKTAARFVASSSQWAGVPHAAAFAAAAGAVAGWFRPRALASDRAIISKSTTVIPRPAGAWNLILGSNGLIRFTLHETEGAAATIIASPVGYAVVDQVVSFCILFGAGGWELWLDGQRVGTPIATHTAGMTENSDDFRFARAGYDDSLYIDVDLDDIMFFGALPTVGDLMLLAQVATDL